MEHPRETRVRQSGVQSREIADQVDRRIGYWIERLHDMSRRNRLLFFKPTRASTAMILDPPPNVLFDRLVVKGRSVSFPRNDDTEPPEGVEEQDIGWSKKRSRRFNEVLADPPGVQLLRALSNLRTRARTAREEKGVNVLHLAFGFLLWGEGTDSEMCRAPLVLVPVDLRRESLPEPYELSALEEDIVVNPTLQVKLRQDFNLELPDLPDGLNAVGLEQYWEQVDRLVKRYPQWEVRRDVVLGIFSFQSLMIIADLRRSRDKLLGHPLIQALSVPEISLPLPDGLLEARELDERVRPTSVFQVLDADSSQQEAIEAAKAGLSFVLQGPPGTGKSQTIANMVAEFLAQGKHVLFVSQKMAALEVVQRRLDQVGLGEFCLQVHSHKRDKREVIAELGSSLDARSVPSPAQLHSKLEELATIRSQLNSYVRALHRRPFALDLSVHEAYGHLARLDHAPAVRFGVAGLEHLTPEAFYHQRKTVDELASYPQVIDGFAFHPWQGCRIANLALEMRDRIEEGLHKLARDLESFRAGTASLVSHYRVATPRTPQEGWDLLRLARSFTADVIDAPLEELLHRYRKHYQSVLRYIRPSYWRDSALLRDFSRSGKRPDPESVVERLELGRRVQARRTQLPDASAAEEQPLPPVPDLQPMMELARSIRQEREFIAAQFDEGAMPELLASFYTTEYGVLTEWCERQAASIDDLADWVNFCGVRRQGEEAGLSSFISKALEGGVRAADWPSAFMRGFYTLYIDAAAQSAPALRSFRSSAHEVLIKQFQTLDVEQMLLMQRHIRSRVLRSRPEASWLRAASAEETILRREMNKKRRLMPLRRLFTEIPELILALRPCLMVSPLTVSQLLDPDLYHFDLVVFDEASQVPPEYAVASFIRGEQVVIAGDRHQLPPTRFFEVLDLDAFDDEEGPDEFESILNECDAAGMPRKMLSWHYRSRDESLIAFSNFHFYAGRLFTFPAPDRDELGTGLEFVYVPEGVYRRGSGGRDNPLEARRLVQLIVDHFETHPSLSLGVVTFSQAQRDTIERELELALRERPDLHPLLEDKGAEPFFVKNLEAVQGDERDVVFFSVGYGKDEAGRFLMNFGPLNREGGERRLNVAVTRARLQVKLVASILPEDIDLSRTRNRGARLLRDYMSVARDGAQVLYTHLKVDPVAELESPFEVSVHEALAERGLQLRKQVGVSGYRIDLAAVDPEQPGRFLLGIECDGAMYHSAATARDRDRLRQQILENLGWRIHRIWSRDWIENRSREIQKVLTKVEEARASKPHVLPAGGQTVPFRLSSPCSAPAHRASPREVTTKRPAGTKRYQPAVLRTRGSGPRHLRDELLSLIADAFREVTKCEGPVHISVAKRRVAEAWGVKRIGRNVDSQLDAGIRVAIRELGVCRRGNFLWPGNLKTPPVRVPAAEDKARPVEQIDLAELTEGAYVCMKAALSLDEEDLVKETARLFGVRLTDAGRARIAAAVQDLVRSNRVEKRGGKLRLSR